MNFLQSIRTCFKKYAVFKGRATRSEFWWFQLFAIGLTFSAMTLDVAVLGYSADTLFTPLLTSTLVSITMPGLAVTARRLHDIGWSGWVQAPSYATYLVYVDAWFPGFSVSVIGSTGTIVGTFFWIFILLVLIKSSQPHANKYGPNPKTVNSAEVFT
jgi:uncharacterized membrane protein YhaH (DUF805 family)